MDIIKKKALVTAEVNVDMIKKKIPQVEFDIAGYCVNHEVMHSHELSKLISPYQILISEFETIDAEVINHADNLELIICCRAGVASVIDLAVAQERSITIMNNAGRNANAVAEIVIGYILDLYRNITKSHNLVQNRIITKDVREIPKEYRDSIWGLNDESPYVTLRGKSVRNRTLGIIGYGNVGRQVAIKALALGMNVIFYDNASEVRSDLPEIKKVEFLELLRSADVITVHCPVTDDNKFLFSYNQFKEMRKSAYFINTARGTLVDEEALVWALKEKEIAGAAVDVTCVEPIPSDYLLLDVPNLLITPHIAGASDEVIDIGTEMVIQKLTKYLGDKCGKD